MGPLVPEVFSQDFNFVIALIIGFFFGFVLEQAGFSSSKKLTGLFYGYDFVVLRVFFTAGVTAMLGLLFMGNLGMIDLTAIYIQPTFLYSALLGGGIMGLGFIIGGFCPGTSIVAATTGKIDAMVFVLGGGIGVYVFGEIYPAVEAFYKGHNLGALTAFDVMSISPGLFAFLLAAVALLTFILTDKIEDKVNKIKPDIKQPFFKNPRNKYVYWGIAFVAFSVYLIFMDNYQDKALANLKPEKIKLMQQVKSIKPIELAYRIIDNSDELSIVDVRDAEHYKNYTLPGADNISFENIFNKDSYYKIVKNPKTIVFIDKDGETAMKAAALSIQYGKNIAYYLDGGVRAFREQLADIPKLDSNCQDLSKIADYKFLLTAKEKLELIAKQIAERKAVPKIRKAKSPGGC